MIALLLTPCLASTFTDVPSLEALTVRSAAVVEGIVTHTQTAPCSLGLCTTYAIAVTETWRGDPRRRIDVTLPGGRSGGLTQRVAGLPLWRTGDEVVLFLDESGRPTWTSVFTVVYGPARAEERELADPVNRRDLTSVQLLRDRVREAQFPNP